MAGATKSWVHLSATASSEMSVTLQAALLQLLLVTGSTNKGENTEEKQDYWWRSSGAEDAESG